MPLCRNAVHYKPDFRESNDVKAANHAWPCHINHPCLTADGALQTIPLVGRRNLRRNGRQQARGTRGHALCRTATQVPAQADAIVKVDHLRWANRTHGTRPGLPRRAVVAAGSDRVHGRSSFGPKPFATRGTHKFVSVLGHVRKIISSKVRPASSNARPSAHGVGRSSLQHQTHQALPEPKSRPPRGLPSDWVGVRPR
jgi:hypothetical protein